jgi:hypothetical protein
MKRNENRRTNENERKKDRYFLSALLTESRSFSFVAGLQFQVVSVSPHYLMIDRNTHETATR